MAKEPLLVFPLAIMIVVALLGIVVAGLSGDTLTTDGVNAHGGGTGYYTNSPISNGVINGMEPLGGGIIDTATGQPDTNGNNIAPRTTTFDIFTNIAIGLGFVIIAAIALATISGVNIFGSGMNAAVTSIIFNYGTLTAIWLCLTLAAQSIFFGDTPLGIGLIFYAILSIAYLSGMVFHTRAAAV